VQLSAKQQSRACSASRDPAMALSEFIQIPQLKHEASPPLVYVLMALQLCVPFPKNISLKRNKNVLKILLLWLWLAFASADVCGEATRDSL
jgi:hypothetical protein